MLLRVCASLTGMRTEHLARSFGSIAFNELLSSTVCHVNTIMRCELRPPLSLSIPSTGFF
ncbi:hypothetical protein I7I50_06674 [Histoplasma capsulatum G186AR]|uniref:Uncharacterized protein n=1 Tax=Ajellomyces capsulatus TaxID=5037 RepID=A0A8H7Z295_AJECA|nr:hypothetical protein I7I52_10252 [Histoplasma capsulatum]QSS67555.1 hypothetical protein I7I50_06674 [Histoplasma capsulatum G186AR]